MGRVPRWICACFMALALTACHGRQPDASAVSTAPPPGPTLTDAYLTDDRDNDISKTLFDPGQEPIYFIFAAMHVNHVPIKAVWFSDASNGGATTPLAEEEVTAAGTDYNGAFSHRPPRSGWRPGDYHVNIYFGTELVHVEHFKIKPHTTKLGGGDTAYDSVAMEDVGTPEPALPSGGVLEPSVTPIPSGKQGKVTGRVDQGGIPRDALGNPMITLSDGFMLHTSAVCTDVQFLLEVNNARQGYYDNPDMTSDISMAFHQGLNTIRVSWDAPNPDRNCRLAIAIKRNHRLRTLTQIHVIHGSAPTGSYAIAVRVQ